MAAGRRGRGSPYPFHITLDGFGCMLTAQKGGTLDWDEQVDPLVGPEGAGTQKNVLLREDFSGGFGHSRDDGTPEARRALFASRVYDRTGRDGVGGGVDPRFGGLMRGPRVRRYGLTGDGGLGPPSLAGYHVGSQVVRKLAVFTPSSGTYADRPVFLAAVGANLVGTTDPLVWGVGPTAFVARAFNDGSGNYFNITDLKVFGARQGAPELEIALDGYPRHVTYDLATFMPDGTTAVGATSSRVVNPQAVYFWDNSQGQFYDLTATLTDDNAETGAGDYLDGFQTADYLLVGFRHVFDAVQFTLGEHQNGNAAVMGVKYYDGNAANPDPNWDTTDLSALADGTIDPAGVSWGKSGTVTWIYDGSNDDWIPAVITNTYESEPLYFAKIGFNAALDNNISLLEVRVHYRLQPDAYAVSGTNLVMVQDNALISTPGGGTDGKVYDTTGPFAIPASAGGAFSGTAGKVVAAVNLAGTVYVVKTDGIYSVTSGGIPTELTPHWAEQPSVEDVRDGGGAVIAATHETQGVTVWDNKLYAAHDWEIVEVTPDGGGNTVGPERLTFGSTSVQFRATALEGHGLHFLYAAFKGSDGNSYLGAYGVYRHITTPTTGIEEWQRMDVWAIIGDLGGRTITSMRVMHHAVTHQPYLVMGDEFAEVLIASLPRGFHPQAPNSGYEWSDALAEVTFPEYDGFDASRSVTALRSIWRLRYVDATHRIEMLTKGGRPDVVTGGDPWTLRATVTDAPDGDGFDDVALDPLHEAYGLNIRLHLIAPVGDRTSGPIVDAFAPWYRQSPSGNRRTWVFNIQAHDRVMTLQGRRRPFTVGAWEVYVRGLLGRRIALVTPTGEFRSVMVDSIKETVGRPAPQGPPILAYQFRCSSAE